MTGGGLLFFGLPRIVPSKRRMREPEAWFSVDMMVVEEVQVSGAKPWALPNLVLLPSPGHEVTVSGSGLAP